MLQTHLLLLSLLLALAARSRQQLLQPSLQVSLPRATSIPLPSTTAEPAAEDASHTAQVFYEAWQARGYLKMYSPLAAQSQALLDDRSFVERHNEIMIAATVESLGVEQLSLVQEGNRVAIDVRVTWETVVVCALSRNYTLPLVFEEGRWANSGPMGLSCPNWPAATVSLPIIPT